MRFGVSGEEIDKVPVARVNVDVFVNIQCQEPVGGFDGLFRLGRAKGGVLGIYFSVVGKLMPPSNWRRSRYGHVAEHQLEPTRRPSC